MIDELFELVVAKPHLYVEKDDSILDEFFLLDLLKSDDELLVEI